MKNKNEIKNLSLKEQMTLVRQEIKRFISINESKKKEISYDDLNELLPLEIIDDRAIDFFMESMEQNKIVFQKSKLHKTDRSDKEFFLSEVDEVEEEEEAEESKDDYKEYSGSDPVRLYLRKMGNVSLLDREGEVIIAKSIEKGEREIIRALLMNPIGTHAIIAIGENVKKNRIKVKSIFRGLEDEGHQYNEEEYKEKIFELIGHVRYYQKQAKPCFEKIRIKGYSEENSRILDSLSKSVDKLMESFESVNFNRKIINSISTKLRNSLARMEIGKRKEMLCKNFSEI